jgi:hypothetical protein
MGKLGRSMLRPYMVLFFILMLDYCEGKKEGGRGRLSIQQPRACEYVKALKPRPAGR